MSDAESCFAVLCGGIGLIITSSLGVWCSLEAYGANGCCGRRCGGQRGCCGSCFDAGFNRDSWEHDNGEANHSAQTGPTPGGNEGQNMVEQPSRTVEMKTPVTAAKADDS